ncbi:ABC-type transport auxiliary lipoprotein family protein [Sandarakinorhabdus sp.]|uniref:ABC-type transport auxiliary lipoprotein family protein n=1 Tax=Sandarakinorhabdus sp. TaxID=1916663 RepID=UPI00286EA30E|nr:ABC-type transport auxiliary lipoprotein family protein [Sandarakinorhabdus sp.]
MMRQQLRSQLRQQLRQQLRLPPVLLILALSGCGPLVQIGGNTPAPEALLTLSAAAVPRPYGGPAAVGETLSVAVPSVPAVLQTLRLPVTTSSVETSYLAGASWAEQPARQFQRVLADTLTADGQAVIDARTGAVPAARQLTGTLRSFGLDVSGAAVVRVRYDAQLAGPRGNGSVAIRRFDTEEPVSSQTPAAVAAALNRAANRVAADVAAWVRG